MQLPTKGLTAALFILDQKIKRTQISNNRRTNWQWNASSNNLNHEYFIRQLIYQAAWCKRYYVLQVSIWNSSQIWPFAIVPSVHSRFQFNDPIKEYLWGERRIFVESEAIKKEQHFQFAYSYLLKVPHNPHHIIALSNYACNCLVLFNVFYETRFHSLNRFIFPTA